MDIKPRDIRIHGRKIIEAKEEVPAIPAVKGEAQVAILCKSEEVCTEICDRMATLGFEAMNQVEFLDEVSVTFSAETEQEIVDAVKLVKLGPVSETEPVVEEKPTKKSKKKNGKKTEDWPE